MITDDLLTALKIYLQIDTSDTSEDDFLKELLLGAESFIYDYYGIATIDRTLEEIFSYNGEFIYTKRGYIRELAEVQENDTTADLSTYFYNRNKIIPPSNIPYKTQLKIKYSVGYDNIDDVPMALRTGLFIFTKKLYTDATKNSDTYAQVSSNIRERVNFIEQLPLVADSLLASMKIFRL